MIHKCTERVAFIHLKCILPGEIDVVNPQGCPSVLILYRTSPGMSLQGVSIALKGHSLMIPAFFQEVLKWRNLSVLHSGYKVTFETVPQETSVIYAILDISKTKHTISAQYQRLSADISSF